jgi:transcriptional regulator with XRE-family HTH domain
MIVSMRLGVDMVISERLRALRQQKGLSQGAIQERTGLLRCYISRLENSHTVPSIDTLEKLARALELPMYKLFYDGEEPPTPCNPRRSQPESEDMWGSSGRDKKTLHKFRELFSRTTRRDLELLMQTAEKLANERRAKSSTK